MVRNHKVTGTSSTIPVGITLGVLAGLIISLIGAAVCAYMINAEIIPQNSIGSCAIIILALGAAIGAVIAMRRIKRLRMQMCLITGLCYYLVLLAITALFFGGQYQGMGAAALAVLVGSGIVALLGMKEKKSWKGKHKKGAYR